MEQQASKAIIRSLVILGTVIICGTAGFLVFLPRQKALAEGTFVPATQIATAEQIDQAITGAINITEEFTRADAHRQARATKIKNGDTDYLVIKFIAKETCGKSGCLHVITNLKNQVSKNLNLVDVSGEQLINKGSEPSCLKVKQPIGERIQDFDICSG